MKRLLLLSAGLMLACPAYADTDVEPAMVCRMELPAGEPDIFTASFPLARWEDQATGPRHADVMQPPRPRPDWIDGGGSSKPRPVTPAPTPVPLPGTSALIGAGIAALGVLAGIRRWRA